MRRRHRPSQPTRRDAVVTVRPPLVAVIALVAMLAAACADPVTEPAVAPPSAAQPDTIDPEQADPDRPDPENRLPDDHLAGPGVCVADVEREVLDTISAQLADLARRDFSAALSQATTAFQAGTDAAAFRALIEGSFPLLLEDATAELSECFLRGPATAEARVEVTTGDRVSAPFVYRLQLDDGRWAIDAAARLTPPPATA